MYKLGIWLVLLIGLAFGLVWSWENWPVTVSVVSPSRGLAVDSIYATGVVEPSVTLPIAPRQAGHLIELAVDEGQTVHKGQLLARLDDSDLVNATVELAARAEFARQYLQRVQTLVARNVMAKVDLDRAQADFAAANAAVKRSQAQRNFMQLTASADGLIIRRDGEVGQYIAAGQALFHLSCCAPLRVTAQVDEEDISRVKLGQQVVMRSDDLPEQVFEGEVTEITPKGDPVARSYRVRIRLPEPGPLLIGMTMDTNLIIEQRQNVLLVPTLALDKQSVWLVEQGKLHKQAVVLGIQGAERTEIISGLAENAQLVTTLSSGLREGLRVNLHSAAQP